MIVSAKSNLNGSLISVIWVYHGEQVLSVLIWFVLDMFFWIWDLVASALISYVQIRVCWGFLPEVLWLDFSPELVLQQFLGWFSRSFLRFGLVGEGYPSRLVWSYVCWFCSCCFLLCVYCLMVSAFGAHNYGWSFVFDFVASAGSFYLGVLLLNGPISIGAHFGQFFAFLPTLGLWGLSFIG